jgi:hypothetical protein
MFDRPKRQPDRYLNMKLEIGASVQSYNVKQSGVQVGIKCLEMYKLTNRLEK